VLEEIKDELWVNAGKFELVGEGVAVVSLWGDVATGCAASFYDILSV
jgi:hypothetical protein